VTNRVCDYCSFAARFIGIGYLVLWPLTRPDPFGVMRLCPSNTQAWRLFCHWPHLFDFTPGLQLIGMPCAGWLFIDLLLRQILRWRRARAERAAAALALTAGTASALAQPAQRAPFVAPLPKVKPRSEFGLRAAARTLRESGVD
jgi:hypothetical protein